MCDWFVEFALFLICEVWRLGSLDEALSVDVHLLHDYERALLAGYGLDLEHVHGSCDRKLSICRLYVTESCFCV